MTDWLKIQERTAESLKRGEMPVLATLVSVEGPSYRPAGARMLVWPDGASEGMISGGCLERDIVLHALAMKAGDPPRLLKYSTADSQDLLLGTGTGCGGTLYLLLEVLSTESELGRLLRGELSKAYAAEALVFAAEGEGEGVPKPGARIWLCEKGELRQAEAERGKWADEPSAELRELQIQARRGHWPGKGGVTRRYERGSGHFRALLEVWKPIPSLLICGAGDDALPLARMALELGWQVAVADHREEKLAPARLPEKAQALTAGAADFAQRAADYSCVVIMSHSIQWDKYYLNQLLEQERSYLGILGPRTRTNRLLSERAVPSHLHGPVGLDLGARTAAEIALAILAELLQIWNQATGRPLSAERP